MLEGAFERGFLLTSLNPGLLSFLLCVFARVVISSTHHAVHKGIFEVDVGDAVGRSTAMNHGAATYPSIMTTVGCFRANVFAIGI